jgi:hypothetical protein
MKKPRHNPAPEVGSNANGGGRAPSPAGYLWDSRAGHPLTKREEQEITNNLVGFFNVLAEWDAAERGANALPAEPAMIISKDLTEEVQ